ncbi:unnamed protein product [Dovyalis caffra]|uniref:Uncharacterized protein n=1 Tax=Dovyalis caffra TaxID=77055 RepID=A0AAV1QY88_9ROSI|nr:unnamed protein product [Dovyalis caffra]
MLIRPLPHSREQHLIDGLKHSQSLLVTRNPPLHWYSSSPILPKFAKNREPFLKTGAMCLALEEDSIQLKGSNLMTYYFADFETLIQSLKTDSSRNKNHTVEPESKQIEEVEVHSSRGMAWNGYEGLKKIEFDFCRERLGIFRNLIGFDNE